MVVVVPLEAVGGGRTGRLNPWDQVIRMPGDQDDEPETNSTRWAVLVAGSSGYGNYRHQADVCHAYQILKRGGLKDENIVVFMYDDIAASELNPRQGIIINHPQGQDVYAGVPKDYIGKHVTVENLYAVLLGDKKAMKGGSGKVVDSKPNDRIFLYYSDHGGPGVLGMPSMPFLYGKDFIEVLKKKHASGSYKEMVIYVEACESGSVFEGLMPKDLDVYVTTASNAEESSWGTYCPGMDPAPPSEYITCLGDLYSVAWMEDSETHNLKKETIEQQYTNYKKSEKGSGEKTKIIKQITETIMHRIHLDGSIHTIGMLLFGPQMGPSILTSTRKPGLAIVDDWICLKSLVRVFENHCGSLTQYGMKHMRAFANICNKGVSEAAMEEASMVACGGRNSGQWHPSKIGYSA
ncbi:hypothetical protein LOK49_LG13G01401 [Camellia lanceoleosa]|uniref:Uncharacterized protein n=1 Tax=Camellia lanceoleosa TaxID=1840588 RepID=A0ACC0FHA5_9ERIC|nr:hypothetical protein LOK49_LG13G01401 [Camellia lanceoleosa]